MAASQHPSTSFSEGTIFISVVAYCDPELATTLLSLLAQAERPELLYVGLIWQGEGTGLSAAELQNLAKLWQVLGHTFKATGRSKLPLPVGREIYQEELLEGHLRRVCMLAEEARGPCWARYLAQLLWHGEDFYLQLDSHMRFVPGWDREMRAQLAECYSQSQKPVLCGYGRGYQLGEPHNWAPTPGAVVSGFNCAGFFDADNVLNIRYRTLNKDWATPHRSFFWSAHFSFSSAEMLREVPYDPQLLMLFYGEEILMTVRLFTHGWDLFGPSSGLVYHLWERDYRRVYMADMTPLYAELSRAARRRMHSLLGSGPKPFFEEAIEAWPLPGDVTKRQHDRDPFNLGEARSLEEYERAADLSFTDRYLGPYALRGGAAGEEVFVASEDGDQAALEKRCRSRPQG